MQYNFFENREVLLCYDTSQAKWYIKNFKNGDYYDLSSSNNLSSFLQIFYEDPPIFFKNLSQKAKAVGLPEDIFNSLPFKATIILCIQNRMFFWLELSLKWLDFINVDDDLKNALYIVIDDPKSPQNLRHRLIKFIK